MFMHMHIKAREQPQVFQVASTLCFETRYLTDLGAHLVD